jgi:hypothetical protein
VYSSDTSDEVSAPCFGRDGLSGLVDIGEGEAIDATSRGLIAADADAHKALGTAIAVDVARFPAWCTPRTNLH